MAVREKVFKPGEKISPPYELKHSVKVLNDMQDAPDVDGMKPVHRRILFAMRELRNYYQFQDLYILQEPRRKYRES